MFDKIIVGYDGRDGGKDAAALALGVADPEAEIVLVNAFPHEQYPNRAVARDFEQAMAKDAEDLLREASRAFPRVRTAAIPAAKPAHEIQRYARKEGATLIVVGSDRHGAVGRILMGDTAAAIMHEAPCPVLVAPNGYRDVAAAAAHPAGATA